MKVVLCIFALVVTVSKILIFHIFGLEKVGQCLVV